MGSDISMQFKLEEEIMCRYEVGSSCRVINLCLAGGRKRFNLFGQACLGYRMASPVTMRSCRFMMAHCQSK